MRHKIAGRQLSRNSSHREAMFRNMVTSLMAHGRIKTTEPKAKELRRYAEKVITLGKRVVPSDLQGLEGDALQKATAKRLHAIRQARHWVRDEAALHMVFNEYAERYKARPGGYTRILKIGYRPGDDAKMALIELVDHVAPTSAEPEAEDTAAEVEETAAKPKRSRKKKATEEAE